MQLSHWPAAGVAATDAVQRCLPAYQHLVFLPLLVLKKTSQTFTTVTVYVVLITDMLTTLIKSCPDKHQHEMKDYVLTQ